MFSKKKTIWRFTNGVELNKKEFLDYVEKKVFKTIRKFKMLEQNAKREIPISNSKDRNTQVLNYILKKKLRTEMSSKALFSSENLSDSSEKIFNQILKGNFSVRKRKENRPLLFHSDKEIELYAKLKRIKVRKKIRNQRIQEFFEKFMKKNPDLEHNILNAFKQLE